MATMILTDVAKSALGVVVAQQLDLSHKLNFGNSLIMRNGSNGVIYFLISDAINYVSGGGSKLLSGNISAVVDDSVFLGALSAGSELSHADSMLYDTLSNVTTDRKTLSILVDSAIISGGRILGDYIDSTAGLPSYVHAIRHPTLFFRGA